MTDVQFRHYNLQEDMAFHRKHNTMFADFRK